MSGPGEASDTVTAGGPEKFDTPAEKEPMKFALPPLDNGAKCFYDTEAKAVWVGIPIGPGVDPLAASFFLDAAKLEFLKHYQREMPAIMEALKRRQSLMGKAKKSIGEMMARLGGKS